MSGSPLPITGWWGWEKSLICLGLETPVYLARPNVRNTLLRPFLPPERSETRLTNQFNKKVAD